MNDANKILVIPKGYTLTVKSWDNDFDNENTLTYHTESKEKALVLKSMCDTLFKSKNSVHKGIGNTLNNMPDEEFQKVKEKSLEFMRPHYKLFYDELCEYDPKYSKDYKMLWLCCDYATELLGSNEYYYCRVCESCKITYSPEDIYLEEIK